MSWNKPQQTVVKRKAEFHSHGDLKRVTVFCDDVTSVAESMHGTWIYLGNFSFHLSEPYEEVISTLRDSDMPYENLSGWPYGD